MLRELFALPEYSRHLTFKGGTSLSKCWNLIDRFSEDIDLVLDRESLGFGGDDSPEAPDLSRKERDRRLAAVSRACSHAVATKIKPALMARLGVIIPAGETWSLDIDDTDRDNATLLFHYPHIGQVAARGYVTPSVKLEFGARGDPGPKAERGVVSFVAEEYPRLFDVPPVPVGALRPERTFLEKLMLLHEEVVRQPPRSLKARLARHYYDVYCLIRAGIGREVAADRALFDRAAAHRQLYFHKSGVDYSTLRPDSLRLTPPPDQVSAWKTDYGAMGEMFAGTPPPFDEVLSVVGDFEREFNLIRW